MPHFLKMGVTLMIVGLIATAILAGVEDVTRAPIAHTQRQELLNALTQVLPKGFDNAPEKDFVQLGDKRINRKAKPVPFYRSRKGGANHGVAFMITAPDGYSGNIDILMGVDATGTVTGINIVSHAETPGLGDKIFKNNWLGAFIGKNLKNVRWGVKKDGGEFDQFAGATITPRAIVNAIKRGLDYYAENQDTIFKTPAEESAK
ncbi:Ion-translocating oxidoreductase complex subunit G [Candidatus Magnetaquicoccaceae bacterium FCR-1]|uniref:Ion-translocating oxidoreductase complex subunit G n=2 Tax=Candidatus Magnetaquiglobus chichijimensis TaxID=3141448 RepID=A0ABQ0C8I7_9PROT